MSKQLLETICLENKLKKYQDFFLSWLSMLWNPKYKKKKPKFNGCGGTIP